MILSEIFKLDLCHLFIANFKCINQETATDGLHYLNFKTLLDFAQNMENVADLKIFKKNKDKKIEMIE